MARILVQIDGTTMFDAEVTDWTAPPTPPQMPNAEMRAADMPPSVRQILAKALCKMIEQATGFKVDVRD